MIQSMELTPVNENETVSVGASANATERPLNESPSTVTPAPLSAVHARFARTGTLEVERRVARLDSERCGQRDAGQERAEGYAQSHRAHASESGRGTTRRER